MRNPKLLLLKQMDAKISEYRLIASTKQLEGNWIKSIRTALNMTMLQLASKMGLGKQSILQYEKSEALGNISIKNLREIASAMDMDLVYGFVPKDGSLEKLVERKAEFIARKIVMRTHQNMKLESQETSDKNIETAIKELKEEFKRELHKSLWD